MSNQQKNTQPALEKIVALAKRRGFIFPTSEIYGGLANSYDYGPMGSILLKNIKDLWWQQFIIDRDDIYGIDSQILLNPETWVASGHVNSFTDALVEDKKTNLRYRADHVIGHWLEKQTDPEFEKVDINDLTTDDMARMIQTYQIKSPDGNELTEPKDFQLLFETEIGVIAGKKAKVYLRGETAQGIFTNFKQVLNSTRAKLPFGIGQIGKSFRNEITKGQFIFRTIEFEQGEIEYFFNPAETDWQKLMDSWKDQMMTFVTDSLGVNPKNLRWRRHTDKERSHYSRDTYDLDYNYPFGWKELWGVAYRTDYDLKQHIEHSGQSLEYIDPYTHQKMIPHVIEPAVGINRLLLMILVDAYKQDNQGRLYLDLKPNLAPYNVAVFPLLKNKAELVEKARSVYQQLKQKFHTTYDERGNIGKRYLYQDEIGTPYCITIDFDTLDDETVTVRDRNTTNQTRLKLDELEEYLIKMLHS